MLELMQHTPMIDIMSDEECKIFNQELSRIRNAVAALPHIAP